jgi:two-component system sensor histidine kinase MprB
VSSAVNPAVSSAVNPPVRTGRRLTLRARFTLVAAGAVAMTALAITAVAYLSIRTDLQNQVRANLASRAATVIHQAGRFHGRVPARWVPPHSDQFGAAVPYTQVITASGVTWTPPGDGGMLTPDATAISVAAGRHPSYYANTVIQGSSATVLTTPLGHGLALQLAAPLGQTDAEVEAAGAVLGVLSVIGVAVAALLGLGVARAGLAPVARLAAVAEEVTATGDPGRPLASRQLREASGDDELGRLATSVNRMLSALQRSLATQRQLVSDASHELRTPLTSLRVNAELLAGHPGMPAAERTAVLDRVVAQAAELSDLVSSLTELARGEGPEEVHRGAAMKKITSAALDAARRDWPRTEFRVALEDYPVEGSAERLRIAVRNLLDNAAKFGPAEGPVEVRLRPGELTVRDHGPGISERDVPFVFDRFYRASGARSVPGSGLGLSVVSDVARRHGGTIEAVPAPGGGTLMRLCLPPA